MSKQAMYSLCIAVLLISGTLNAEDDSVVPYSETGLIDRVGNNEIVVDDTLYEIVPYAKIHANSKYPGVYVVESLTSGMIVGAKFESVAGYKSEVITELWLLDSLPPVEDDD